MVGYKPTNQVSREGWEFSTGHSALPRWSRIISYDPFVVMKRHQSVQEAWQRCCGLPGSQHLTETSLTDTDLEAQGLVPNKPLPKSQSLIRAPSPLSLGWSYQLWIRWAKWGVLVIRLTRFHLSPMQRAKADRLWTHSLKKKQQQKNRCLTYLPSALSESHCPQIKKRNHQKGGY